MKVRVIQIGARKNYVVPSALARASMLELLCTDFYDNTTWSPVAKQSLRLLGLGKIAKRLQGRTAAEVQSQQVKKFPLAGMKKWLAVQRARKSGLFYRAQLEGSRLFCNAVAKLPLDGVDAVYAYSSAALEVFQKAKPLGIMCVLDHETAPATLEDARVREGINLYPEWTMEATLASAAGLAEYAERQRQECELADLIISPSTFCQSLIEQFVPGTPGSLKTIPFAVAERFSDAWQKKEPSGKLRVLLVGDDALRKGLPVLVEALRQSPPNSLEVRGIGHWNLSNFGWSEARKVMHCLGSIPRTEIQQHFRWADVLVLPTFSDTMGVVILEAMASGATVITTPNSGGPDLIREGVEGFIVPVNDSNRLAERLQWLATHPAQLSAMQSNALQRVQEFSLPKYQDALVHAIRHQFRGRLGHSTQPDLRRKPS